MAFALADVDATVEQRDRIATIMKAAANDLQASRKLHMQARRQSMQLLTASTIDRAQLEKLRVEQMQLGDSTSRRLLQAMIDSAEVLTPEQRAKVAERWQKRTPPNRTAHFSPPRLRSPIRQPLRLPVFHPAAAALHCMQ